MEFGLGLAGVRIALIFLAMVGAAAQPGPIRLGSLLVATEKSKGPAFSKSVALVVYASAEAVLGLFVNRPPESGTMWIGGPVALGTNALVNAKAAPPGSRPLLPGVFIVPDVGTLPRAAGSSPYRVYVGTCGWSMRQMTAEMKAGLWRVMPGSAEVVFDEKPETLWERLRVAGRG